MAQILLVDDDTNVLLTLAIALRRQGHVVTVAQNGWQALNLLRQQQFTFLISDVKMPGMSGQELAQRTQSLATPPRVILTSALEVDWDPNIVEAFLPKPIDVDRLSGIIQPTETRQETSPPHAQRKPNPHHWQRRIPALG